MDVFEASLAEVHESVKVLDESLSQSHRALEMAFRRLDDTVVQHGARLKEYKRLCSMIDELEANGEDVTSARERLFGIKEALNRLRSSKPRTGSFFLRLTLGRVNVKVWKRSEMVQLKKEYNKFKARTTYIFILLPLMQLQWPELRLLTILHQLFLFYYYTTLAVRENVLQVNGSSIKNWWIYHHYLSIALSLVILLWPYSESSRIFSDWTSKLLVYQGFVMIMMNLYQDRRAYVRKSLGKTRDIDPTFTEALHESPKELFLLLPLLLMLYAAYMYLAGYMFTHFMYVPSKTECWLMLVAGILLLVIGVGNTLTTWSTIREKNVSRRLKARTKLHPQ